MIAEKRALDWEPRPLQWTEGEYNRMLRLGLLADRDVSFRDGVLYERTPAGETVPLQWSGEEYYRLGDAGLLDGVRVELVEGVIIEMSPINSPHATCVTLVGDCLRSLFSSGFVVRTQNPLALGSGGYPEPDIAVVRGNPRDFANEHPREAVLVVEVADSSLRYDRTTKVPLYSAAGIPEYWIVNLIHRTLEVYRLTQDSSGRGYDPPTEHGPDDEIPPLCRPEARVWVADLLP